MVFGWKGPGYYPDEWGDDEESSEESNSSLESQGEWIGLAETSTSSTPSSQESTPISSTSTSAPRKRPPPLLETPCKRKLFLTKENGNGKPT